MLCLHLLPREMRVVVPMELSALCCIRCISRNSGVVRVGVQKLSVLLGGFGRRFMFCCLVVFRPLDLTSFGVGSNENIWACLVLLLAFLPSPAYVLFKWWLRA